MPLLTRVQVRLVRDGAMPEDDVINTFHFDADDPTGELNDLADRVWAFYDAIAVIYSGLLSGQLNMKIYNMEDAEPRVPVHTAEHTLAITAGVELPAELAICLSYHAAPVAGVNQARRRGRIFLGPLASRVLETTGADARVEGEDRTIIANAAGALMSGPDPGDSKWAVYSPTTDLTASLADSYNDVTGGWVDNAFDIQRRRGAKATTRTTFPVV